MWCSWVYMGNNQKFWTHFAEGILLVYFAVFSWCIANICSVVSQWDTFSKPKSISIVISGLLRCKLILQSKFPQIVLTLFLDFRIILSESCSWAQASTCWYIERELLSNCIITIQLLKLLLFGWFFRHLSVCAGRLGYSPKAKYTCYSCCETNTSWVSPCGWTGARIFLSLLINSKMVELFKVVWWIHWDTITPTGRRRESEVYSAWHQQRATVSIS